MEREYFQQMLLKKPEDKLASGKYKMPNELSSFSKNTPDLSVSTVKES